MSFTEKLDFAEKCLTPMITAELAPFFKFANDNNPSKWYRTFIDGDLSLRTHKVYLSCVKCNTPRFTDSEFSCLSVEDDKTKTHFCPGCKEEVMKTITKYHTGMSTVANRVFKTLWDDFLFNRSRL